MYDVCVDTAKSSCTPDAEISAHLTLLVLLLKVIVKAPICHRMTDESWERDSHVINFEKQVCKGESGGMT
jgi:hypothetical protein